MQLEANCKRSLDKQRQQCVYVCGLELTFCGKAMTAGELFGDVSDVVGLSLGRMGGTLRPTNEQEHSTTA